MKREKNRKPLWECETNTDSGPVNGFWRNADWLFCRDEKWRAVEPGTFPLAPRLPVGVVPSGDPSPSDVASTQEARVMRLKGYGNSIVVP